MSTINRSIALVVEGMGSSASSSAGIAWYYGRSTIGTPGDYEWIGGSGSGEGLVEPPESVGSMVDPWEMSLRGSAQEFRIHATDQAKALWLHKPIRPKDLLNAELSESATSITFDGEATWSSSNEGDVVWIGDEAIKLNTYGSGDTFSSVTRGHWGTTAMLQPAKMNVWAYNPFRVRRLARIILYDHDTGTTSQAWQGFVEGISIDGPVIRVACSDILSKIRSGEVNRNPQRLNVVVAGDLNSTTQDWNNGGLNMRAGTRAAPRVNKSGATEPHWVACQAGEALFYLQFQADFAATADDGGTASLPQLGSELDPDDIGRRSSPADVGDVYELLVVDAARDVTIPSSLTLTTYANRRSSTRDLQYSLNPIAITMALWTSTDETTPGVAGTGAGGDAQTAPGDTIADEASSPTQYFDSTGGDDDEDIMVLCARNVTAGAIIGTSGSSSASHYKLIPADGGAETWRMSASELYSTAGEAGGAYVDAAETYAYVLLDGSDGVTYAGAGRPLLMRLDMTDGTQDWVGEPEFGGASTAQQSAHSLAVDEATNNELYCLVAASGDEIKRHNTTDGSQESASGNDSPLGSGAAACGVTPDGDYLVVLGLGAGCEVGYWSLPLTGTATRNDVYPTAEFAADGTDSTNDFGYFQDSTYSGQVVAARDGTNRVWICGGFFGTADTRYIGLFDPTGGTKGAMDVEVDVAADANFTPGTYNYVLSVAVDQWGYVYALITNGTTSADTDIVRYEPDGTFDLSFNAQGVTFPTISATSNMPTRIDVDQSDNVLMGTRDGNVYVYTQS